MCCWPDLWLIWRGPHQAHLNWYISLYKGFKHPITKRIHLHHHTTFNTCRKNQNDLMAPLLQNRDFSLTSVHLHSSKKMKCLPLKQAAGACHLHTVFFSSSQLSLSLGPPLCAFAHSKCRQFQLAKFNTAVSLVTPHTISKLWLNTLRYTPKIQCVKIH